jgi:hypothetical protein
MVIVGVAARLLAVTWMVAFGSAAEARWSVANPIPTPYEIQGFWATRSGEILAWAGGQVLRRNARAWVEEAALPDSIDFLWEDRAGDVWAVSRYTIPGVHGCWGDICEDSPERGVKVVFQRHAGHWQQTARTECSHDRRGQDPIDRLAPCELTTAERKHASEMPAPLPDHELQALWQANVGAGEGLPQKLLRGWRFAGGQVWATGRAPQSILHRRGQCQRRRPGRGVGGLAAGRLGGHGPVAIPLGRPGWSGALTLGRRDVAPSVRIARTAVRARCRGT